MELKGKQIRMDLNLWESLATVGRDLGIIHDADGNHSKLIREILSTAVVRWLESPYICQSAKYFVLVTGEGTVFFRQVQRLKLNKTRERLPCLMEMKPEKRKEFFGLKHEEEDDATFFRSRWLINYFEVWHGKDIESGQSLSAWVDRLGTDTKQADLPVGLGPGSILTREILVGAHNYVQRRKKGSKHECDRVGFPVDIPTREMEALVVVDMDLYRNGSLPLQEIPLLELEFRNRESAKFEGDGISHDLWNPIKHRSAGKHLIESPDPHAKEILDHLVAFKERVETLAQSQVDDGPVVDLEQRPALQNALKIPEQFIYHKLAWPSPYLGVEVCVRWQKPEECSYYVDQAVPLEAPSVSEKVVPEGGETADPERYTQEGPLSSEDSTVSEPFGGRRVSGKGRRDGTRSLGEAKRGGPSRP